MLWFNCNIQDLIVISNIFQYILCCGSTLYNKIIPCELPNFNTSYVVVQLSRGKVQETQSQHFNTSYVVVQPSLAISKKSEKEFQYILCCGSTKIK